MKKKILSALSFIVIAVVGCTSDKGEVPQPVAALLTDCESVSYTNDIAPFMAANCAGCHSASFTNYDLTHYEGVKQKVDNGSLRNRVLVIKDMPGAYCPMTEQDMKNLECWLNNGAPNN